MIAGILEDPSATFIVIIRGIDLGKESHWLLTNLAKKAVCGRQVSHVQPCRFPSYFTGEETAL